MKIILYTLLIFLVLPLTSYSQVDKNISNIIKHFVNELNETDSLSVNIFFDKVTALDSFAVPYLISSWNSKFSYEKNIILCLAVGKVHSSNILDLLVEVNENNNCNIIRQMSVITLLYIRMNLERYLMLNIYPNIKIFDILIESLTDSTYIKYFELTPDSPREIGEMALLGLGIYLIFGGEENPLNKISEINTKQERFSFQTKFRCWFRLNKENFSWYRELNVFMFSK